MEARPQHPPRAEDDHQRADQEMEEQGEEKHQVSAGPPPSSSRSDPRPTTPPGPGGGEPPSPMQSPLHPIDSASDSSLSSDQSSISRLSSPREDGRGKSPPPATADPDSPPQAQPLPLAAAVSVRRSVRDGPGPLTVVDLGAESEQVKQESGVEAGAGASDLPAGSGGGGSGGRGRVRPNLSILRRTRRERTVRRALLVLRVCGLVLCLVSFSVMVADKNQGWAIDSFYRYREFRYIAAVNGIGFLYSGLQACDVSYFSATGKSVARFPLRHYLDFFLDQVMSYLLLSASSSAATRVDDWESNWGEDKFPQMATASVALSILAFMAFALCSIISGYTLCTLRSS
ncbi:CASP-like protein 4A1 [Syzygium oleosum]|uniref:CASP-like protein 4A1 n=1 Tax=Syzygium oleosum TaxID=219896 RepID=UPI0011D268F7|nr:CASP-like protein 4A1 [Syzygium oleosum]